MKRPLLPVIATLCIALPLSSTALAAAPKTEKQAQPVEKPAAQSQIRVQVEFIDVSHEQLTELMFGAKPAANDTELRQQVAQLVKDGKAKIMETLLCTGRSGEKSSTESIEELIYPTEYEPAEFLAPTTEKKEGESQNLKEPATPVADATGKREAIGPTPTAFETRNLGSTLEIEPALSKDGKTIDLRLAPEMVYHVGNEIWLEWKDAHGSAHIQMPTMYVLRLKTAVRLTSGKPFLAGTLTPKNDKGAPDFTRKVMIFVKADVLAE